MATRQGRKYVDPCTAKIRDCIGAAPYLSILCNNVQIYGEDVQNVPPTFIIKTLVERGSIAFLRNEKQWAAYSKTGRSYRTNLPKTIRLVGDMGYLSEPLNVNPDNSGDVCIIPANAFFTAPYIEILDKVATLNAVSVSLAQNLDSIKQATAILYDDENMKGQIEAAENKRKNGAATVLIQKRAGSEISLENFAPNAQCYIPELLQVWTNTVEELNELAGKVKVGEKTERRTDDEISVIENSACSTIDTIIDTFNAYCKWYGIKARAERGTEIKKQEIKERGEDIDNGNIDEYAANSGAMGVAAAGDK